MRVIWSVTSAENGRMGPVADTGFEELEARFARLRSAGQGYVEVELPVENSPQLSVGFRGDRAVVQQLTDLDGQPRSFLLMGDGSLAPDATVTVPIMAEDGVFTGGFVMSVDRAWETVRDFVRDGSTAGSGEWFEL